MLRLFLNCKTNCIIVTYFPDLDRLEKCIRRIFDEVENIYVVDNSDSVVDFENIKSISSNIEVMPLMSNVGIAKAQNIGIKKALENGADYILLSDQDTIYPDNYVANMLKGFEVTSLKEICAVVPLFCDENSRHTSAGFIGKSSWGFKRFFPNSGHHPVFQAIASGSILKSSILDEIGLMNEELFIDWVDLEWCWRANKLGYEILGNADVIINHQLGDKAINIGVREVNMRSSIRHYYITRNAFYLSLYCESIDLKHKIVLFFKSFKYIVGFTFLSNEKISNFKITLRAFFDGINGKIGKYSD